MKTNNFRSTNVEDLRVINFLKMQQVLLLLQEKVKEMELQANGLDEATPINYRATATDRKAVMAFSGTGFNMTINLTQPAAGKGSKS